MPACPPAAGQGVFLIRAELWCEWLRLQGEVVRLLVQGCSLACGLYGSSVLLSKRRQLFKNHNSIGHSHVHVSSNQLFRALPSGLHWKLKILLLAVFPLFYYLFNFIMFTEQISVLLFWGCCDAGAGSGGCCACSNLRSTYSSLGSKSLGWLGCPAPTALLVVLEFEEQLRFLLLKQADGFEYVSWYPLKISVKSRLTHYWFCVVITWCS